MSPVLLLGRLGDPYARLRSGLVRRVLAVGFSLAFVPVVSLLCYSGLCSPFKKTIHKVSLERREPLWWNSQLLDVSSLTVEVANSVQLKYGQSAIKCVMDIESESELIDACTALDKFIGQFLWCVDQNGGSKSLAEEFAGWSHACKLVQHGATEADASRLGD
jgi:hypothetical protein